ncbi:MAG: PaaI family thioesterase [Chloroflexi bacterium]|nr:PaaI family thioesterase [Chloroflexota bacterium]MBU1749530.1 PaaI family thioesterase [Chloroflexota bacterium]
MNPERTAKLARFFNEGAPIARLFGMTLSFTDEGQAVVDLAYNPDLDHAAGGVHGGIYCTMLDVAGWRNATAAAAHPESCWIATSELTIHFLAPVERTALRAVGRLIKPGKRQYVAEAHLYDAQARLVGHAVGTFVVLPHLPRS